MTASKTQVCDIVSAFLITAAFASAQPASRCESLGSLQLPHTSVTSAELVDAGSFSGLDEFPGRATAMRTFPDLPAFCRVRATSRPTPDSEIKIEVWLPVSGWNGKLEANGNGGWTGTISPATLAAGLRRGYAAAMTDTGHAGGSASFALGHPEKVIDFGYRAVHEMATNSKAIVTAYYGAAAKLSYFDGCSAGGREAFKEAQLYPEDFNGMVAGSPGIDWTGRAMQSVWIAQAVHKEEGAAIPNTKFADIHAAVLQACDAADGVKDGIIEDPRRCQFDPKVLECAGGDGPHCLTKPQVETARKIYAPVVNPRTGQQLFGGLVPGSELGWGTMGGAQPMRAGIELFKFVVFNNPDWNYQTFDFDRDAARTVAAGSMMDAVDPDLRPYFGRGGKIVHYHGWADPQISPLSSVKYYNDVLEKLGGKEKVQDSYRLFMVPGMAHCGGGEGTSSFDMLTALEQWVESERAPDQIAASRIRDGKVDRTRPLCPYPQVAKYVGSGSIDDARNFVCKLP